MNLKKFISGVSAFAIAASAFAAMAVTASATEYGPTTITISNSDASGFQKQNSDGTFKTKDNSAGAKANYSRIVADLSGLEDIDNATSVTVEFDTKLPLSGTTAPKLVYGVGDAATRGTLAGGSNGTGYNYNGEGLLMCFGSLNGSSYSVKTNTVDTVNALAGKVVRARITLDRENDTYSVKLTPATGNSVERTDIATSIDNLTVIEAFSWGSAAYDLTFNNIKVSYTVPDAPAETTEAGFTYKTTIEKLTTGTVSLTIEATNGEEIKEDTIDITDKLEGFAGELMLAVVIDEVPEGITITSASISLD